MINKLAINNFDKTPKDNYERSLANYEDDISLKPEPKKKHDRTKRLLDIDENKLLQGDDRELLHIVKDEKGGGEILKKLYRIHIRFDMILDDSITVNRKETSSEIDDESVKKSGIKDRPGIANYGEYVERELEKLDKSDY